jgi:hypothetical protein
MNQITIQGEQFTRFVNLPQTEQENLSNRFVLTNLNTNNLIVDRFKRVFLQTSESSYTTITLRPESIICGGFHTHRGY